MKHDSNVTSTVGHLIDGKRVDGGSRVQPVFDPATGESHKSVALADKLTVEAAIASAQASVLYTSPSTRDGLLSLIQYSA